MGGSLTAIIYGVVAISLTIPNFFSLGSQPGHRRWSYVRRESYFHAAPNPKGNAKLVRGLPIRGLGLTTPAGWLLPRLTSLSGALHRIGSCKRLLLSDGILHRHLDPTASLQAPWNSTFTAAAVSGRSTPGEMRYSPSTLRRP